MNSLIGWVSAHPIISITLAVILLLMAIPLVVNRRRKFWRATGWANSNIQPYRTAANPPRPIGEVKSVPLEIRSHLDPTTEHRAEVRTFKSDEHFRGPTND